jgi:MerR family transcriptional regulator, copper efflux regulator
MNIRELISVVGREDVQERQIRFLISECFVPPPTGGRANADYGREHVAAIRRYIKLKDLGFPPKAIRALLETRQGAPAPVVRGITLVIDPELIGSGAPVEPIMERVERILHDYLSETKNGRHKR